MLKYPRILFFIENAMPTQADISAIAKLGGNAVFRNAFYCGEGHNTENCDGVAGAVPDAYKKFKDGAEVVAAFIAANIKEDAPVSTVPEAPVVPPVPDTPVDPVIPPAPDVPAPVEAPEIPPAPVDVDAGWGQPPAQE